MSSWEQENKKKNDPGNEKCSEWIQSGCPLGSNMLINACPAYKRKPSNNNYRQNKERKGRKRILIHNQRIIGIFSLIYFYMTKIILERLRTFI